MSENRAFVIMQIGEKGSPDRRRAEEVYRHVIVPILQRVGLQPYRSDLDPTPGPINQQMLGRLLDAIPTSSTSWASSTRSHVRSSRSWIVQSPFRSTRTTSGSSSLVNIAVLYLQLRQKRRRLLWSGRSTWCSRLVMSPL